MRSFSACLAVLALLIAGAAVAQIQTGNLYGTVSDTRGARMPGVTVTLTTPSGPQVEVTDAYGEFRFLGLLPGRYQATAQLQGFVTGNDPNISISVGRNTVVNFALVSSP